MSCLKCGSERLFQFETSAVPSPPAKETLPLVCRACGAIAISGELVDLPEVLAKPIRELAEKAAAYGKRGREELEELASKDPEARVEGYMSNFYRAAYLDGFFRALAFFRHNSKEGRLIRLRELWGEGNPCWHPEGAEPEASLKGRLFDLEAYTEFDKLLHLSVVPGESNAKNPSHENAARKENSAHLS